MPVHMVQGDPAPAPLYPSQAAQAAQAATAPAVSPATAAASGQPGAVAAAGQASSANPAQPADTVTISPEAAKAQQAPGDAKPVPPAHATYHPSRRR